MSERAPRKPRGHDTGHVAEQALGGGAELALEQRPRKENARRSPLLRVVDRIDTRPVFWQPRPGLPRGGRAECRSGERPCPYVRCSRHLWTVLADDRQGRRALRPGELVRAPAGTTLLPAWLEHPTPACCASDFADAAARGVRFTWREIAAALHLSQRSVYAIRGSILGKLGADPLARELAAQLG